MRDLGGIDERDVDAEPRELLGEQRVRSSIDPRAGDQVVAGTQEREQRARGRTHSASKEHGRFGALERRDASLNELRVRRVAVARIAQAFARTDFLNEVDRLHERIDDRRVDVAAFVSRMDGDRREISRLLLASQLTRGFLSRAPSDGARGYRDQV